MSVFPEVITKLPEAGLGIDGLRIYISHAETHEVWFLETDIDIDYPIHAHKAQWSNVVAGKIEVTVNGEKKVCEKGDTYYLPEGVEDVCWLCRNHLFGRCKHEYRTIQFPLETMTLKGFCIGV